MRFETDPSVALEMLREASFDALVTDMRMPGMDGAELLAQARQIRSGMARIVLSGYSERAAAVRSVALAHQFLTKPCSAQALQATVSRVCNLRSLLQEPGLVDTIGKLGMLPSLPALYEAITDEVSRRNASLTHIAGIISRDLAMTAKVLQLVNSSFFGLGKRVFDIEESVNYLGIDIIRALVTSEGAFGAFEPAAEIGSFEALWRHSSLTGLLAGRIAEMEVNDDCMLRGEALQAGMLHDIGELALASRLPQVYRSVRSAAESGDASVSMRERALVGCDHGRVGAYLMGLWGLSDRIVEAIAYHHTPRECSYSGWSPLTAVHAANALVNEHLGTGEAELDTKYLHDLGCSGRIEAWRREAGSIIESSGDVVVSGGGTLESRGFAGHG